MSKKILVVCAANSFRSACAEALLKKLVKERGIDATVEGCGVVPEVLNGTMKVSPYAIKLMADRGIDVSGHTPRHVSQVDIRSFDKIFTMDDELRHKLLEAGAEPQKIVIINEADGAIPDTWPHGKDKEHADCVLVLERALAEEVTRL